MGAGGLSVTLRVTWPTSEVRIQAGAQHPDGARPRLPGQRAGTSNCFSEGQPFSISSLPSSESKKGRLESWDTRQGFHHTILAQRESSDGRAPFALYFMSLTQPPT